ncbi:hypothetical protein GGR53DRAFT_525466 [Hypoxylon sp. FL1150]|nr:hypothetical protein GGR53DRAFT_525466 [Hypoxylon sp. FL1150]
MELPKIMENDLGNPNSFLDKHEAGGDVPSSLHTEEGISYRFTSPRKPVASTASFLPTITATGADAPLLTSTPQSRRRIISKRGGNWNWEFFALSVSFSSMATMVALLAYVDGRPPPQWNGFLSLNALISSLGAISRTSMGFAISSCLAQAKWNWFKRRTDTLIAFDRFDEASRGPWGSLWLVIWLRASHWVVVGAIVTIILIGFEPFLQAVVSFSGEMDTSTTPLGAHIGRSEVIDVGLYFSDGASIAYAIPLPDNTKMELQTYKFLADLGMLSAFNSGLYNAYGTEQTTSFVCPTANCTWPTFTSLAVCSACRDAASYLRLSKQQGTGLGTLPPPPNSAIFSNYTTYVLPQVNITNLSGSSGMDPGSAYMAATVITDPRLTISFGNLTTMITTVQVIKAAEGYETGSLIWDETPMSATECALYFCVNAYRSVVQAGILRERIVASWAERDFSSYRDTGRRENFELYEKLNNYSLYTRDGDLARTDLGLFIPKEDAGKFALSDDVGVRFNLTQQTVGSMTHFVNEQLLGPVMTWPPPDSKTQPSVVQALYKSKDLLDTFDKIAWSVSGWMRDVSNVTQEGVGEEWVMHIYVEWPYMVLPLLTIVLGLFFCLSSMLETRRLHLDPWKTDMVATLTYSVDAETRAQLRHADRNGYLEKSIRAMTAKFEDVGCGLELRTQQT